MSEANNSHPQSAGEQNGYQGPQQGASYQQPYTQQGYAYQQQPGTGPSQSRADLLPIQIPAIPARIIQIHMGRRAVLPIMQDIMRVPSMRRRALMARRCRMGQGPILKLPQAF